MADTDREKRARDAVRRVKKSLPELFDRKRAKAKMRRMVRARLEVQDIDVLLAAAREGSSDAIDILREYARGARRHGLKVPDDFHAFVWEFFVDGPPKAKAGTKAGEDALRDIAIAILVKIVSQDHSLNISRKPEWSGEEGGPICALQLVADEFGLG